MATVKVKSGSEWIEVPSFSVTSIPEAPTDGKQYARQNANWTEVLSGDKTNVLILSLENDLANGQKDSPVEAEVSTALKDAISNGKACVIKSANSDILANLQQIGDNVTIVMEQISRIGQTFVAVNTTITVNTATNVISDYQTGALVLETEGDGSKFLSNNGTYKEIPQPDLSNYLAKNNTTEFTPDAAYEPATKKYVDDRFLTAIVENVNQFNTKYNIGINEYFQYKFVIATGRIYGSFVGIEHPLGYMYEENSITLSSCDFYKVYSSDDNKLKFRAKIEVSDDGTDLAVKLILLERVLTESEYSALGDSVNTDGYKFNLFHYI